MNYKQEDFKYKADTSNPAVLGVLEGPVADIVNPTRNGRKYSEQLWEKVFNDPLVREKLECGGIFGESQHPVDRQEVDTEKIAIAMKEAPVKHDDGKLYARFYILDTPCGRILKTLADFGYKIGISSRGSGDTYTDVDGEEAVDPDTYDFECFDAVLLPSVKEARMSVVNESLEGKNLKKAINESLEKATPDERKVMEECLREYNINYNQPQAGVNIDGVSESVAVENSEAVVNELQESLKKVKQLEATVLDLQEKLSVSYTKEATNADSIARYKKAITKLNSKVSDVTTLNELNKRLDEQLKASNRQVLELTKQLNSCQQTANDTGEKSKQLQESLKTSESEVKRAKTAHAKLLRQSISEKKELTEQLSQAKKDAEIKQQQYSQKLSRANSLVEKYKKVAQAAVDKYIHLQAVRLGISDEEIHNRLKESYTFDDIDQICEKLKTYNVSMSKLPFNAVLNESMKIKVNPSQKPSLPVINTNSDDDVDSQLLTIAGLH